MTRVMIIETRKKSLWLAKKLLSSLNFEIVFETTNGYEALEKFDLIGPDLLMFNLNSSNNDELFIIQEIKKKNSSSKIVVLTSNLDKKLVDDCLNAGALHCLSIPFKMIEFVSVMTGIEMGSQEKTEIKPLIIEEP